MPETVIRMQQASKRYHDVWAVRDVELCVPVGERLVLIGPSGCGKTTCLRLINRLVEATSGQIEVLGEDVSAVDAAILRRKIGYVIQDVGLFPHYTVAQNVSIVPGLVGWKRDRIQTRIAELLSLVGLPQEEFGARYPNQLSGGQRQRVGIARALAADPPLVLMDEPFGALDPITRASIQDEFLSLARRLNKTFVLVTHDIFEAVRLTDRIVVMKAGCIEQIGTPFELCHEPKSDFVLSLLGAHRYQLKLMTVSLRHAASQTQLTEPNGLLAGSSSAKRLSLEPDCSVWHALEGLAESNAELIETRLENETVLLSHKQLLASV